MATIKFLLQSDSTSAPIYLRFSLGRNNAFKRKTGYIIDSKSWSKETGLPVQRNADTKNLKADLASLEGYVLKAFNADNAKGILINGNWLSSIIDRYYDRREPEQREFITTYGDFFLENLPQKVTSAGTKGVTKDTVGKYKTIVDKLKGFETHKKKKYLIKELDIRFRDEFIRYLVEVEKLSDNTAGRYISFVKTIVLDARRNGFDISPQINDFRGYTVQAPIVVLSFEEIQKIKDANITDNRLITARDWLVIGCYVGQRVSDLLRMNANFIHKHGVYSFIEIVQEKTKKTVQIPVHEEVQIILDKRDGQFPPVFANTPDSNSTMFNRYLKDVCKEAGINTPTKGNLNNPETGVYGTGEYPKWMLVSSHICRRSFATNFYAEREYPTPLLMNVTGHTTEAMFLQYIGKKPLDYALQLAEIWAEKARAKSEQKKEEKKSKLTVLRASNI